MPYAYLPLIYEAKAFLNTYGANMTIPIINAEGNKADALRRMSKDIVNGG
jgi:hypothetical protein